MSQERISFDYSAPKTLRIKLRGDWLVAVSLPEVKEVTSQLAAHADIAQIAFDVSELSKWDSSLVSFLLSLIKECNSKNVSVSHDALPQGAQKLLLLSLQENGKEHSRSIIRESFLQIIGSRVLRIKESTLSLLDFLGEIAISFAGLVKGKSNFRRDNFVYTIQKCGVSALPLVSLISVLVGIILAFVGAIQLKMFGAQVYIADIVGISMVRVMGAVMTGVLMSGRTGASFAAELGIMQVNEEIDSLKTLGVSPVDFLVMPRLLALVIMMPLLTIYSDFMGILGGFIVSTGMLNINPAEYINHTQEAVKLNNLWVGLTHSFVFGIIIAVAGCMRGIKCARSAEAVGEAATSAVVYGITGIVIATAVITFTCQVLGV